MRLIDADMIPEIMWKQLDLTRPLLPTDFLAMVINILPTVELCREQKNWVDIDAVIEELVNGKEIIAGKHVAPVETLDLYSCQIAYNSGINTEIEIIQRERGKI